MVNKPKQIEFFDILIQQNNEILSNFIFDNIENFCCFKPSGLIQQIYKQNWFGRGVVENPFQWDAKQPSEIVQ